MKNKLIKLLRNVDETDISGIKNMLLKPVNMIISLLYTPLLLSYLGDEKYGLWSTILSIIHWIDYCDIGIGHGLRNLLTRELTEKEYEKAKKSVSTAYVVLSAIAFVILLFLVIWTFVFNWNSFFNTEINMKYPMLITFVFLVINFVLALSNTLLYSLQLSERVALRSSLVQLFNLAGVFLLNIFTHANLIYMAILFGATSSVIYIANSIQIFKKYKYLCPSIKSFDKSKISEISNLGLKFFVIQLSVLLMYSVDRVIITHYFGPEDVTALDVTNKIFSLGNTFLAAMMVPYLSRTTEALKKGNILWIKKAVRKMYSFYLLFAVAYIVLALLFKPLMKIYIGRELDYQSGLIFTMCLYYLVYSFVTINTPFINGTGEINAQLVVSVISGIISVPLSIYLGVNCGLETVGVKLATTIILLFGAVFYPINLHMILKKAEKNLKSTET